MLLSLIAFVQTNNYTIAIGLLVLFLMFTIIDYIFPFTFIWFPFFYVVLWDPTLKFLELTNDKYTAFVFGYWIIIMITTIGILVYATWFVLNHRKQFYRLDF